MNGMRVKLTFTFTAMANCFPLAVTVVGLTEKKMPGVDFVHVQIPRLCIGGGGVSVDSNQQFRHLFLMRNTEGAKKDCFRYYQEHILLPGINLQRKKYCNFDINAGTTIHNKTTAVASCDGDMSQIDAIKQCVDLYVENKIIANKQNAAWFLKRRAKVETVSLRAIIYGTLQSSERQEVWSKDLFLMTSSRARTDQFRLALGT
jgi:hypothetical protein